MASYDIVVAPRALGQLQGYLDYINWVLMNEIAARAVYEDTQAVIASLKTMPFVFPLCAHASLREYGYRLAKLKHHKYVMLYRVLENTVVIEAMYHQLQDYENVFSALAQPGEI